MPGRKVFPYLLHGLTIRRGFPYLVAIIDWASQAVPSWRLSNKMDAGFCVSALEEAPAQASPSYFKMARMHPDT